MDADLLNSLRDKFGDVYAVNIDGREFAYRGLTMQEINDFERLADSSADLEDLYVKSAIIYPDNFDINKIKAGHVSSLAEAIGKISGTNINFILNTLDAARLRAQEDIIVKIKAMILAAMPAYTEEYLSSLTMKQLLEKLVLSEEILTIHQVVNGVQSTEGVRLELIPAEELEKPKRKAKPKVDKETLLRRIASEERKTVNPTAPIPDIETLNELDETLLEKALGYVDSDDPIARKLKQAMGG